MSMSNEDLNRLYSEAEAVDKPLFAEQRSNLLIVAGEHYSRPAWKKFTNTVRNTAGLPEEQKLRLTKNHTKRIMDVYQNTILTHSPGVTIVPDIETELQDRKTAELNLAIWQDAKQRYKINSKIRDWCKDFTEIGEVIVKITWNPDKGDLIGYAPVMEALDFPLVMDDGGEIYEQEAKDENGNMVPDKSKPIFSGDFEFTRIFGFNLLRSPEAQSMDESKYLIERKMVSTSDLKKKYAEDEEKLKYITKSSEEAFLVFDNTSNSHRMSKDETLLQCFYFRPCMKYPEGYYYIKTSDGILEEGVLPYSIFPIVYQNFDAVQTSARGTSRIKLFRPYNIEINRASSQQVMHQITVGDDKLIMNTSGRIEAGAAMPGIRVVKVPGGGNLTVLPGRAGEQFFPYIQATITELYNIAAVEESYADKNDGTTDPMVTLFKSIKQKKQFSLYIEKFEEFIVNVAELYLELAKKYLPEDRIIPAIGRREIVNIPEFKNSEKLGYRIKIEPQSDDIETKMGKQLVLNHALQYVGSQLNPETIGKLIKNMPFGNVEDVFDDLTLDENNADNDILSLERGEYVPANPHDNHEYMLKRLSNRKKQPDFKYLKPEIQEMFEQRLMEHEGYKAQAIQDEQAINAGFIPTGGYMVKADVYTTDADGKTKRVSLPYESVQWLLDRLEKQGLAQEDLERMDVKVKADIAQEMMNNPGQASPEQGV